MMYLGDYPQNGTVDFMWSTNAADGSSITRATNGTISVYKANSATQSTAGISDTEDFDGLTGIHHCRILLTDAFYAAGNDYNIVLSGATIDSKTVNAVLASFSIQNRYTSVGPTAAAIADAVWDEATSGHLLAGSAGKALLDANNGTPPTAAAIADQVWDEPAADHNTAGSTGNKLNTSAPTAAAVADAVWDEALSGHLLAGSAGDALNDAGGAQADPWTAPLPGSYASGTAGWIVGQRLDAKVSSVSGNSPGAGAYEFTYTLTDSSDNSPIADADVWVTSDAGGLDVLASGRTNSSGQVVFYLDDGTVYFWRQKPGWNFTNPDTEVVG